MLDPDVVLSADSVAMRGAGGPEVRGAAAVARLYSGRAQAATAALVDGEVGIVVAPRGRLLFAIRVTVAGDRIRRFEVIGERDRLQALEVAAFDGGDGPARPDRADGGSR